MTDLASTDAKQRKKEKEQALNELTSGPSGIEKWNARSKFSLRSLGSFRKSKFQNTEIKQAKIRGLDLGGSDFSDSKLADVVFDDAKLKKTSFKNAKLEGCQFKYCTADEADFSGAILDGSTLHNCLLKNAIFNSASLQKTYIVDCDIRGADFSSCDMSNFELKRSHYDEYTKLPPGYVNVDLHWCGQGVNPAAKQEIKLASAGATDFASFMERLEKQTDSSRLSKVTKMLKAEKFQLFAQVTDDTIIGVVKSQTDPDLVYAGILASSGSFGCCTQNLNYCGGLRGALCKHILVLLIGLTKAGEIKANQALEWALTSGLNAPKIDKDIMSEVFLRYKGAESGEIDWRPTETIPEDYYSF